MLMLILTFSILLMFMHHPLSLGFIILVQTSLISLITGILNYNFWFSYILFLILIGGMMILFIYMTSIASNEKFKFSMKLSIFILMLFLLMLIFMKNSYFQIFNIPNLYILSMNKFINSNMILTFYLMILYLFITLIAVVNLTKSMSSPLRQMT